MSSTLREEVSVTRVARESSVYVAFWCVVVGLWMLIGDLGLLRVLYCVGGLRPLASERHAYAYGYGLFYLAFSPKEPWPHPTASLNLGGVTPL